MTEEVKNNLTQALQNAGLPEGLIKLFNVSEEGQIEAAVAATKQLFEKKPFKELVNTDKDYQKDFDRYVTQAMDKREQKIKEEFNLVKKEGTPGNGADDTGASIDEKFEARFKKIEEMITGQRRASDLEKKKTEAERLLKEANIPSELIGLFKFEGDETVADQFTTVKSSYDKIKDNFAQQKGAPIVTPDGGTGGEPSQEFLDRVVDNL